MLASSQIPGHNVSVTADRSLSTVRGVISETDHMECLGDEIFESLWDTGAVAIEQINFRQNCKYVNTKHLIHAIKMLSCQVQ